MRVLFFSHQAEFIYGGEICTLELMRALKQRGVEIYFASPPGPYQEKAKEITTCFSVSSVQFKRSLISTPKFLKAFYRTRRELKQIIAQQNITIVHATSLKAMVYLLGLGKYKKIWHHHDILPKKISNALWLKGIASAADQIITPSKAGANALVDIGIPLDKVQTIYNGLELQRWKPLLVKKNPEALRIAFLGEISSRKGSDWIYPIAVELQNKKIAFTMDVVGTGLSEPLFFERIQKENAELVKEGFVKFHGRREDIAEFLQTVDVLLVPSRQDPLPTVIVEAFFSGLPAIGNPVGGIPEMIEEGKNGYLAANPQEFVEKIMLLKKNYQELSRGARKTAEEKFSLDKMAEEVLKVYQSL